jgi:DNA mismatch repair protein MutL
MSKIRVLSDHIANQIAAGEVVERPASVAKELVENSIDAGATRITVEIEGGGRRLLKVSDDGEGMVRDDALLAFERHATSKISRSEDLSSIATLGFRGEALASIASVARIELITRTEEASAGTRVAIEGGRMRDVKDAAHPRGTTIAVKDLFFNVPARRKFLRSEATETFHLTNLVTHYALAHPEIAFTLVNNGREALRAAPAKDLSERAYQIFGQEFLDNLLEVDGGDAEVARIRGYVSAPRDRRNSRDAQYLFVNGRFVRDRLIGRSLSEGYRSILPHGVYPAALLFLETPLEEVDVNVHPAKTEVRFRRAAAVADAVREAVRAALASAGYVEKQVAVAAGAVEQAPSPNPVRPAVEIEPPPVFASTTVAPRAEQPRMDFAIEPPRIDYVPAPQIEEAPEIDDGWTERFVGYEPAVVTPDAKVALPPLASAEKFVSRVAVDNLSPSIRTLGQLDESFIVAIDEEGLLLIDQHVAHERILFDKYRALESARKSESQSMLVPETFDLTPAQAAAFDDVVPELESYGFELMRLSGRTVAIKATPGDLPAAEARNMLAEILDSVDGEKRGVARETLRDEIAASLACHAAIKVNTPLAPEKMRWLIDRLLVTSSPTTCPHGRPIILRLSTRDILKGFHRI